MSIKENVSARLGDTTSIPASSVIKTLNLGATTTKQNAPEQRVV